VQRYWTSAAVLLGKHARWVAAAAVVLTIVFGLGLRNLEFATGQDSYLRDDEQVAIDNRAYQELFGGQAMLTLFYTDGESDLVDLLSDPDSRGQIERVAEEIRSDEGVLGVVSPVTALEFTQSMVQDGVASAILSGAIARDPDPASQEVRQEDLGVTAQRLGEAGEQSFDNPEWVRFLLYDNRDEIRKALRPFFPTEQQAQMVVRLQGNADIETEGETAEMILAATSTLDLEGFETLTTGAPVLLKDINDYLQGGMLQLGAIAFALMAILLVLAFKVRWRLLPLGVVFLGIIWAFGLFGYTGIPLSLVTISGLPILIGIGIDFAIQTHSRIEEEVVLDREDHPIAETTRNLAPALIVAALAAIVAFTALQLSQVPMIRQWGVLLSIGMAMLCFVGIFLPASALGAREYRKRTQGGDYTAGRIGRAVVKLGSLPQKIVPALMAVSVVLFIGGIFAEEGFELQTDPEEWVDQSSAVIQDLNTLRDETGSASELGYFIQSDDVFTDDTVEFVHDMATRELEADVLLTASSVVTTVSFLMEMPDTTTLPPLGSDVEAAWNVAPIDIQRSTASPDGSALNLIFRVGEGSLADRADLIDDIEARIDTPPGTSATASGLAVVGVGLLRNIEANRTMLTYVALGLVGLFLALRLKSAVRSLLCLVPVLVAVGTSSIVVWALGFELSPLTAVGGPLVVALCTEFTTLIILRYMEERRRGLVPQEASDVAAARTGRAFVASALTTVGGFGVLIFSALPLLRDFGAIVALNVAVALLSALIFLPPMLVWADNRKLVMGRSFREPGATSKEPLNLVPAGSEVGSRAGNGQGDGRANGQGSARPSGAIPDKE
jgi:uncharacterized protein